MILSRFYNRYYINPSRPNPGRREKVKLNFDFYTSLWCLKRFYEGFMRHHKEVWKSKFNLIFISIQLLEMHGTLRVNILIKIWKNNDFCVIFGLLTLLHFHLQNNFKVTMISMSTWYKTPWLLPGKIRKMGMKSSWDFEKT